MIHQPFLVFALCAVLLASCSLPSIGTLTPEQAAQELAPGTGFRMVGSRQLPNGKLLVLYRVRSDMLGQAPMNMFGEALVARNGLGWISEGGGAGGPIPPITDFINYGFRSSAQPSATLAIVYGETLSPDVVAVEAVFDNGQTVRDEAGDGIFVLTTTNADTLCKLRVLGENNIVLRTITDQLPVTSRPGGPLPSQCP